MSVCTAVRGDYSRTLSHQTESTEESPMSVGITRRGPALQRTQQDRGVVHQQSTPNRYQHPFPAQPSDMTLTCFGAAKQCGNSIQLFLIATRSDDNTTPH